MGKTYETIWGARNGNYERNAVVKNPVTKQRGKRILGDCWQWEANGQCSKGHSCSFRHDVNKRANMTQPNPSPNTFMLQDARKTSRTRSPRGKGSSGRMSRWQGLLHRNLHPPIHSVTSGTLQNACSTRPRVVAALEKNVRMHFLRLMNSFAKCLKRMMTKVQWPC